MNSETQKSHAMRRRPRQVRSQERVNQILDVAEALFISEGYTATTTNAIATTAKVSIGSLYQFFPDKAAILKALAERYAVKLREVLIAINSEALDVGVYAEAIIDAVYDFFITHRGYYAIFISLQGVMPQLQEIDELADAQLIQDLAVTLGKYYSHLEINARDRISFVLVKTIGNLVWIALGQTEGLRDQLIDETKRLIVNYLRSYAAE
jgi:AcrR family transcriptional regulator